MTSKTTVKTAQQANTAMMVATASRVMWAQSLTVLRVHVKVAQPAVSRMELEYARHAMWAKHQTRTNSTV